MGRKSPLAYMGVRASNPPDVTIKGFAPTSDDKEGFELSSIWIDDENVAIYMLANLAEGNATWKNLSQTILTINGDTGTATPSSDTLTIDGNGVISTAAASSTITISLDQGTDGQLLIGATGAEAQWANLTSSGGTILITESPNGINIESSGIDTTFNTDSGSAAPAAGTLTVAGGTNINTSGASSTVTINLDSSPTITGLTLSGATGGVVQTNGSGVVSSSNGTDGQVLIGGSTAPAWANITSTGGTVTVTNGANTINLESSAPDIIWEVKTTTPQQFEVNKGYISTVVTGCEFNLPTTAAVGDRIRVTRSVAGSYIKITQNASQYIVTASGNSTTGVTGYAQCQGSMELLCVIADTCFKVISGEPGFVVSVV